MKVTSALCAVYVCLSALLQVRASAVSDSHVAPASIPVTGALVRRQATRERIVARQIGAQLKAHRRRADSSAIPVNPTICGTLPGQRFLIRAAGADFSDFPTTAPGYLSGSIYPVTAQGISTPGIAANILEAEVYELDANNNCAVTSVSIPDTTLRGSPQGVLQSSTNLVQGTDAQFEASPDMANYAPLLCTFSVGADDNLSCFLADVNTAFLTYQVTERDGYKISPLSATGCYAGCSSNQIVGFNLVLTA